MLTPFGKFLRKLRIDHGELLRDMATTLGVSPAFLSAVENGKRNVPNDWVAQLTVHYDLNATTQTALQQAADESTTFVKMNLTGASDAKREAALVFAREFQSMDDESLQAFLSFVTHRGDDRE